MALVRGDPPVRGVNAREKLEYGELLWGDDGALWDVLAGALGSLSSLWLCLERALKKAWVKLERGVAGIEASVSEGLGSV